LIDVRLATETEGTKGQVLRPLGSACRKILTCNPRHSAVLNLPRRAGGDGWGIPARRAGAISSHVLMAPRTGGETRRQDPRERLYARNRSMTRLSVGLGRIAAAILAGSG
jgi:hypothetical protein